ncbi:MAG: hypothetical protein GX041_06185 [Clostridiales bacterium]|jgi:hypothetical protein|nr:hypothetical protein [Clostridiales bacterium]
MSSGRKDSGMEMGTINRFLKIVIHSVCVFIVLSLIAVPFVQSGTAEYYVLILSLIINGLTVAGIFLSRRIIKKIIKSSNSEEKESDEEKEE